MTGKRKPGPAKGSRKVPNSGGSRKGRPNKATANAREAIARLVDNNADRLQEWLDQIADEQGPEKAFRCLMDVLEYHVPKLARTELTGEGGGAVKTETTFIIEPVKSRE